MENIFQQIYMNNQWFYGINPIDILYPYLKKCKNIFVTVKEKNDNITSLLYGTLDNKYTEHMYINIENYNNDFMIYLENIKNITKNNLNIDYIFEDNLKLDINSMKENYDLIFIDTSHSYGKLKRELEKFSTLTNKYIVIYGTTIDKWTSEYIRKKVNIKEQLKETTFPIDEIKKGLYPAIQEFIDNNPNWTISTHDNKKGGLTILSYTTLFPITFSIPEEKLINSILYKEKILSYLIPDVLDTYIYNTEKEYYEEYQKSMFALTCKKAGYDCMRHYEILANGCIPYFPDIKECSTHTMFLLPKKLFIECNELYHKCSNYIDINDIPDNIKIEYQTLLKQILLYTQEHLTTNKICKYILEKTKHINVSSVLYLSHNETPDYLNNLVLHGFKKKFEIMCHDYPKITHLYKYNNYNYKQLYGKGFSYTNLLDTNFRNDKFDDTIEEDIKNHKYDIVLYSFIHRDKPYYELVNKIYKPNEIILLCGDDIQVPICNHTEYVDKGNFVFVRELM